MSTNRWLLGLGVVSLLLAGRASNQCVAAEKGGTLKFQIYQDAAQQFRWRLKASNAAILATGGQGYKAKADCRKQVERIKTNAKSDRLNFEVYEDKANESRWRLKSRNGQIVASSSEGYKSKADCEHAIDTIKKGAADADVEEK